MIETGDASFDMMQRSGKVRVLSNEQFYEKTPRELGQIRTVEELKTVAAGVIQTVANIDSRIGMLERDRRGETISDAPAMGTTTLQQHYDEQHFSRGSADPPKRTVYNPKSDGFYCKVDRLAGTIDEER